MKFRVGFGFDVHKLVEGRDLWMGGIKIEHSLGLLGHSDAAGRKTESQLDEIVKKYEEFQKDATPFFA